MKMGTYFKRAESFLLCALLLRMDVIVVIFDCIIDLARILGEKLLLFDLTFIGGLSDVGEDSAELLIGDRDGICWGFTLSVFGGLIIGGGGDGVIERDSVSRVYLSEIKPKLNYYFQFN